MLFYHIFNVLPKVLLLLAFLLLLLLFLALVLLLQLKVLFLLGKVWQFLPLTQVSASLAVNHSETAESGDIKMIFFY